MNRKVSLGAASTFAILLIIATFCLTMIFSNQLFNDKLANVKEREQMYDKLAEIDIAVRNQYNGLIDAEVLEDGIAAGYMAGLADGYVSYLNAKEYAEYLQSQSEDVAGIGVTVYAEASGYLLVGEVKASSPAGEAGIMTGDLIVQVDGVQCTSENAEKMIASLSGKAGTTLTITYRRAAEDKSVELVRKKQTVTSVVSKSLDDQVGYLRFVSFGDKTDDECKEAIANLQAAGNTAFVLDVRNTRSEDLASVSRVLEVLLPEGPLAIAEYKDGKKEVLYKSAGKGMSGITLIVLVNEKTEQGAELFAAALRDYGVADLVGGVTAGKGVVRRLQPLSDGSAIWISVAKLSAPKSGVFDKTGLTPDYLQPASENPNAIYEADPQQDPQLKKAMDVLHVVLEKGQDKNEISSEVSSESSSSEEESGQSGEEGESSEKTSA